ncbi:MAG: sialate O-acetylesterase [Verrucomicrobiota bacterium]
MKLLPVLFMCSAFAVPAQTGTVKLPPQEKLKIYLMMGQSNMAGRGVPEAEDKTPHPRVLVFTQSNQWETAVEPLTLGEPKKTPGVGPGLAFAKAMADAHREFTIGLVPCAVGGTPLRRWVKGGDLYENAVKRAQAAAAYGTIAGIIWHQGESDSTKATNANTYGERLTKMISDIRKELKQPNLPFVVGQIGEFGYDRLENPKEFARPLNETLAKLPETVPFTGCALSHGLTSKADFVHFDAKSQRELGQRYAVEMLKLEKRPRLRRGDSERKLLSK